LPIGKNSEVLNLTCHHPVTDFQINDSLLTAIVRVIPGYTFLKRQILAVGPNLGVCYIVVSHIVV